MSKRDPIDEAADLAIEEVVRRLREDPEAVPFHVLGKMVPDLARIMNKREQSDEDEARPFNLLDELPTLPIARGLELIDQELERLEVERDKLVQAKEVRLNAIRRAKEQAAEGSVPRSRETDLASTAR